MITPKLELLEASVRVEKTRIAIYEGLDSQYILDLVTISNRLLVRAKGNTIIEALINLDTELHMIQGRVK